MYTEELIQFLQDNRVLTRIEPSVMDSNLGFTLLHAYDSTNIPHYTPVYADLVIGALLCNGSTVDVRNGLVHVNTPAGWQPTDGLR